MNRLRSLAISLVVLAGIALVAAFAWQQEGWVTPPAVPHELEGRDNCLMCHQAGGLKPVPENHAERPNEACLWCHAGDAAVQTTAPPAIAHDLEGRADCTMCHQEGGMKPAPADHEGRDKQYCQLCHKPAA